MAGCSRRTATAAVGENSSEKEGIDGWTVAVADGSFTESKIAHLRGRWELASVLNFLSVFEPVIGRDLKLTAEEIEAGLVMPNYSLAQLHITLLKGIAPVSKAFDSSGAWVTVLCKKLAPWWPWVAEGEIPLTAAKGEEVLKYKELDPTSRLLILKALCEVRAEQEDAVSYINAALKNGTEISCFRKDKIGGDGKSTSYWYDGNMVIGLRLYKETNELSRAKMKSKPSTDLPAMCSQWETLATNLGEFQRVVGDLSSSKVLAEVVLGKTIEADVLPAVVKFQKKTERALKQKQRQEKLLNDIKSFGARTTRSCRNRRPISYTFDEYDRAMAEAIEVTKKMKTIEEQRKERRQIKQGEISSNGCSDISQDFRESYGNIINVHSAIEAHCADTETKDDRLVAAATDDDYESNLDDINSNAHYFDHSENSFSHDHVWRPVMDHPGEKPVRLASHLAVESRNLVTKKMSRQRPISNSALDSIVPDSDDENLSGHSDGICEQKGPTSVAISEEVSDG